MNISSVTRLLGEWDAFSQQNRNDSLQDFASWLLAKEIGGNLEEESDDFKFKLIELSRILELMAKKIDGDAIDLQTIRILAIVEKLRAPRKQDVVVSSLMETSTGFYLIKTLVKKKLLKEEIDKNDKRSSLISLTTQGRAFLNSRRKDLQKILILQGITSTSEKKVFMRTVNALHAFHKRKFIATND